VENDWQLAVVGAYSVTFDGEFVYFCKPPVLDKMECYYFTFGSVYKRKLMKGTNCCQGLLTIFPPKRQHQEWNMIWQL
jgi:hypothetical protein